MKVMKDKVFNFVRQKKRITKFIAVCEGKVNKKNDFLLPMRIIRESTGGNASAPKCQGAENNKGSQAVKSILDSLAACPDSIEAKCKAEVSKVDTTLIDDCMKKIDSFAKMVDACIDETNPAKTCDCWKEADLETASESLSMCDIAKEMQNVADKKKMCLGAFIECRGKQDEANEYIYVCRPGNTVDKLLSRLKAATETKDALNELKAIIDAAASKKAADQQSRATCAEFTSKTKNAASKANDNPAAPGLAAEIKAVADDPPTACTDAEKAALKKTAAQVNAAITAADTIVAETQSYLEGKNYLRKLYKENHLQYFL